MALKEQDIVFTTTDEAGNTVIQFPITRVENVEDAVRTVNKKKPDSNGDIQIDVDMSHLATKDELTKGLANKRDHTIQIANADLNTLLEDKTWACSGTLKNTPIACTFCIVQVYDTGAPVSGNIVQVCYVPNLTDNTVRTFWRNCNNGVTFGKWSESGAVKTVNSIAPDASGEVTLPNATTSKAGLVRLAAEEDVLNEAPQTAVCTQLIYEINEFRRKSTAYQVGDKVDCAFQYERFLECTKAGKTSAELLDTRNVTHGQVIADGMVEWTVRTHVRSINGSVAGADGNVLVDVGAKTVNGNTPDSNGNVSVDVGVKTVNGNAPDSAGNITLNISSSADMTFSALIDWSAMNRKLGVTDCRTIKVGSSSLKAYGGGTNTGFGSGYSPIEFKSRLSVIASTYDLLLVHACSDGGDRVVTNIVDPDLIYNAQQDKFSTPLIDMGGHYWWVRGSTKNSSQYTLSTTYEGENSGIIEIYGVKVS